MSLETSDLYHLKQYNILVLIYNYTYYILFAITIIIDIILRDEKMNKNIKKTIYTVGYGNSKFEFFIDLLKKYDIHYLIDIRSYPFSKYNKDFNYKELEVKLKDHSIQLVFMGKELGGRPNNQEYYDDGIVMYDRIKDSKIFKDGIERLLKASNINKNVALMCSEMKPENCHRSKLIGQTLIENNVEVLHIDENGEIQTQNYIINKTMKFQPTLFDDSFTSRKAYKKNG